MIQSKGTTSTRYGHALWRLIVSIITILVALAGGQVSSVKVAKAATYDMALQVISAANSPDYGITKGDAITEFKYIINIDNTGTTEQRSPALGTGCNPADPGYPGSCNWVSIAGRANNSPILTQGDQSDFPLANLPAGRYLISVLADGYKIDGAHFSVPFTDGANTITVEMQPYDLPDATIQAEVFEDNAPTNSAPDVPAERGIAGFQAHIVDYIDEVTTDVYGDPLCGDNHCLSKCYAVDGGVDLGIVDPIDSDGRCPFRDELPADAQTVDTLVPIGEDAIIQGKVIIPNLGPNRYALSVVPPNGSPWRQTTTLEGNHDWDAWVMEGATGLDTEFVVAGEPFPATFFGFVQETDFSNSGSGTITGTALAVSAYIPPTGGIGGEAGLLGAKPKDKNPIHRLFVSLSDLNNNDQTVYMHEFDCDEAAGCPPVNFDITGVPDGDYVLGVWDEPQDYIFLEQNVSIVGGETADLGSLSMLGWWTTIEGHVFNDLNANGRMDAGEPGIPNFPIVMRTRENSIMDRGATAVNTDANGYYWMENAYPMTQWLVAEAYADGFHTTGITYQADNQAEETTILGAGVDVNVHPVIGLGGRLDWGVQPYKSGENGGIVGTVSYDTTRNELDPAYAAIEDWQPSIAGLTVDLYAPVDCPYDDITPCDPLGFYALNPDGSYQQGQLLNQYITETWERPSGCVARNVDGDPLINGVDEQVLPPGSDIPGNDQPCLEAPMMGVQFGPMADGVGTSDENFGASVDGNYGFGDGCFGEGGYNPLALTLNNDDDPTNDIPTCMDDSEPTGLPSNMDYLVKVNVPTESDVYGAAAVHPDQPLYKVTREEDINIGNGDSFVPQVPPPACAGALHTVDLAGQGTDGYGPVDVFGDGSVIVPASTPTENQTFLDIGGSIYEGQQKPLCDMKLIHLGDRKSIAPGFNFFTDVPLPSRFWGLIVDDLNFSSNPKSTAYGEKLGIPFAPIGIYDYTNRLITTVESDYNGLWDVLLPSTNRISCPTPSGVCANLYRAVGNDPGTPGHWNPNYTPQYRTIAAEFETFPGLTIPADLAPTPTAVAVQIPGTQTITAVACTVAGNTPQLFAVDKPYTSNTADSSFTITGLGFGDTPGTITLGNTTLPTSSWTDRSITVSTPAGTHSGPQQLKITSANGMSATNGLTFHVLGTDLPPFPATYVLDDFTDRTILGPSWGATTVNGQNGSSFAVINNSGISNDYLRIRSANSVFASARWNQGNLSSIFDINQEAYFTFKQLSSALTSNHQSLMLKWWNSGNSSSSDPGNNSARWIEVAVNAPAGSVDIYAKTGSSTPTTPAASLLGITFANGDVFGARALSDGSVQVYKNGGLVGSVNIPAAASWTGRIGIRFEGTGTGTPSAAETRIDNFGGGSIIMTAYQPTIFEVGVGKQYDPTADAHNTGDPGGEFGPYEHALQDALNDAAGVSQALVVVYPGPVDTNNPRYNNRGAYYENIIMHSPVKLQGVGPGGVYPDGTPVQGTIIDGIGFGGDTDLALGWRTQIENLFVTDPITGELVPGWNGNQDITEGQVIYVLPQRSAPFGSDFKAAIDGINIRGGDQMGFPGNLNAIFGGYQGPAGGANVETQGGAIFANSYANNLQITNNVVEQNSGTYGTIRVGTPNIDKALNNNHNVNISNNRIVANGGSNLAGAIGLFGGSDGYVVSGNDICGNFSAEYGGGISHFGLSPNGSIHDNRIYFNHSYDEGGGIIIAGELATVPGANYGALGGPQGSGAVDIYNNLIQANMSEDDGGGLRFLMAGNFPMNVYNNMLVNNVATHEGGGVALDDASNVRFYNNTVMRNKTTATAITSNGQPAPAGLSTGTNSAQLQATLPGGSPTFSNPLMFNNIFWNNWAGAKGINTVIGITPDDANPWDMGVSSGNLLDLLSPNNSIVETTTGTNLVSAGANPNVVSMLDIPLSFTSWRTNVNFIGAIMVTADLPPSLLSNYHLSDSTSSAFNTGIGTLSGINAPSFDIDNESRPASGGYDQGADELP